MVLARFHDKSGVQKKRQWNATTHIGVHPGLKVRKWGQPHKVKGCPHNEDLIPNASFFTPLFSVLSPQSSVCSFLLAGSGSNKLCKCGTHIIWKHWFFVAGMLKLPFSTWYIKQKPSQECRGLIFFVLGSLYFQLETATRDTDARIKKNFIAIMTVPFSVFKPPFFVCWTYKLLQVCTLFRFTHFFPPGAYTGH